MAITPHTWVLVTGDLVPGGGQDRANLELARALLSRGAQLHLVCHRAEEGLATTPGVTMHRVPRPGGRHALGAPLLDWTARRVVAGLQRAGAEPCVVVNGGNALLRDVCWVHAVHHAWDPQDADAPWARRVRARLQKRSDRRRERWVLSGARCVIANSEQTARQIAELGVSPQRIRVVYLAGDDRTRREIPQVERAQSRQALGLAPDDAVIVFVGALGLDANKGFDLVLAATRLLSDSRRPMQVLAAGAGALDLWRARAERLGVADRVRFLGAGADVPALLAAADLLVAPSRYDAYGLAAHEAIARGLPVIVGSRSGIAERIPADLQSLLVLPHPAAPEALAEAIGGVLARRESVCAQLAPLAARLRDRSWSAAANELIDAVVALR